MDKLLEVKNLRLYYHTSAGAVKALDDVSFNLYKGETLGLVGESGCGKTTTGMALLKMPSPPGHIEEGSQILLSGRDIMPLSEREIRKNIRWEEVSMVFQGAMNCLTPVYTIGKQMLETLHEHRDMDKNHAEELVKEYLGLVGLPPEVMGRFPHEMSGGMKQRVVIATALFLKPKLVILDEPTTALDVIVQAQIINLLKKLKKTFDLSFIFITHDLSLEAEVCDRICVMYAGKIAELGTNQQIYGDQGPMHPYTEKLLQATPLLRKKVETLSYIPGTPPDLINPPTGCRFHPRCHRVMDICSQKEPPLLEVEPGHMVACWRCGK
ncbi:MAG: ABC transporter ATP-binding protein [Spirochaetia bacterium]|jgi:peptide/nickel transport system ATP-binding protein|nr:ABC transporter ATP-binding protein [Spirochaetia bacterium]